MEANDLRHIRLAGAHNIRDLGGYDTVRGGRTKWRTVLRADSPHRLTAAEVEALLDEGVTTVIDLRNADELRKGPNPLQEVEGISYVNVSLFDGLALAGASAGNGDALYDLYVQAIAARGEAVREVLTAIAEAGEGAVLFHCTAGKDRTGLIAALLLALAEVERQHIVEDYALTKQQIVPLIDELIAGAEARGADMAQFLPLLACEGATMQAMLAHIDEQYGSTEAYLLASGLDTDTLARLRARLVEAATEAPVADRRRSS